MVIRKQRITIVALLAVAVVAALSGVVIARASSSANTARTVGESSFGSNSQFYERGARVVVSSPFINNLTDKTVTILGIQPRSKGCPVLFGKAVLMQTDSTIPYLSALEIPPWDPPSQHLVGNRPQTPLVFHHKGGLSSWYSWEFRIPGFCRLTVTGYQVTFEVGGQVGHTFLAQQTVFVPTLKSVWGPKPGS